MSGKRNRRVWREKWTTRVRSGLAGLGQILTHPVETMLVVQSLRKGGANAGANLASRLAKTCRSDFARGLAIGLNRCDKVQAMEFERDGIFWRSDIGDDVGRMLYIDGRYEGLELDAVLAWLGSPGAKGTIVDVGANIGTTSIPFALAGYRVLAIEPVPSTFAMLRHNVSANLLDELITCVQVAVSERSGQLEMWRGFGSGQGEVAVPGLPPSSSRWGDAGELVSVDACPLGRVVADQSISPTEVAMVWADVQGSETSVIETGAELWASQVPLFLEVDPTSLDLHSGVSRFVDAARSNFSSFVSREDLLSGSPLVPIDRFEAWVQSIEAGGYSDALLLPSTS